MNFLKLKHFKCFNEINVELNQLTILAGANGYGKSTIIQALLFLRQTIEECAIFDGHNYFFNDVKNRNISLNGKFCLALGNSSFVLNKDYNGNIITLGFYDENQKLFVDYYADEREPQLWLTGGKVNKSPNINFPLTLHKFYYLNTERIGPRISQSLQYSDFPNAGWQGENTAQLMGLENGYFKVDGSRRFTETESYFLQDQINYWLDFIIKGVRIKVEQSIKTLTSQILIENQYTLAEPTLSTNLGFGISYLLPIIATGLVAAKGSYFIIENPEAHLHPSAQSKIGRFLAMVANSGVNIIIETHSDHIINGFQIAVAKKEIKSNLITINFFSEQVDQNQPLINKIYLSEKGELSDWPSGFFDQTQIDFAELIRIRKK
jgi:predicted ATPase